MDLRFTESIAQRDETTFTRSTANLEFVTGLEAARAKHELAADRYPEISKRAAGLRAYIRPRDGTHIHIYVYIYF